MEFVMILQKPSQTEKLYIVKIVLIFLFPNKSESQYYFKCFLYDIFCFSSLKEDT